MNDLMSNPTRSVAVFAVVFFVLTLISGAGFFGAIGSTVLASAVFYAGMRYLASRRERQGPR